MGAAIGGVGLSAVGYDRLIPYLNQPEDIVPGVSTWYATSCRECPAGCAMVVRNRESHVVKCEGNPLQPISHGTLCARGQAALHGLYDPDRIKRPQRKVDGKFEDASWDDALDDISTALAGQRIALITDLQTGSLDTLMRAWMTAMGGGPVVVYEPINYEPVKAVNGGVVPSFNIADSDYLIAFGCDFLETWVSPVEFAGQFEVMRRVVGGKRGRFIYVGPRVSMTAANADVRIIVPPGAASEVASALLGRASVGGVARKYDLDPRVLSDAAQGLASARAPLALPGWDIDSAQAAAAVNAGRAAGLVNTGRPHAITGISSMADMTALISDMDGGRVDALIIQGANPVYGLPESARFVDALKRVGMVVSLSSFMDETSSRADWVLPSNTPLESWGDYRPYPDVANLMQPTMGLLWNTRHTGDILIELAQRSGANLGAANFLNYLKRQWGVPAGAGQASPEWDSLLRVGGRWPGSTSSGRDATPSTGYSSSVPGGTFPLTPLTPTAGAVTTSASPGTPMASATKPPTGGGKGIRLWAYPHIYFYDGRNANRRWLQEIPEPVTRAVWGSWVEMHPDTARRIGVGMDDVVELEHAGVKLQLPVFVWRGVARDTVAVPIGQGHTDYGRYASGRGVNILRVINAEDPRVTLNAVGDRQWVTRIKGANRQYDRDIARTVALESRFKREKPIRMPLPSGYNERDFYPGHKHAGHRWAMVVDMSKCIGCHACTVACYAENNLAVVGPEGIYRRREMAWLRIDQYVDWQQESAPILFQPMLCQHCDAAPCEPVCPVFAAAHSDEGINMQIYNRCVGTRYCSNNCPYKVRRFNWFDYDWPTPLDWQLNPDVTTRSRGVMEKCTFCIQRIREAEIVAKREGRPVRDGEITPACVQTCPTGVFTFGDLMKDDSRVSQLIRHDPRAYQVLDELNTKTAVIYLKRIVERT
ncbi:4Fe-4S dicluster domain-containing protein [bacterium]|nr:4Fe-4S dicluster domain-containing protein [bacterium]